MESLKELELYRYMTKSLAKKFKILIVSEAAYLAGLIDADGSIFIQKMRRFSGTFGYVPTIRVTNTNRVIVRLCNEYGGFWICQEQTVRWKPVYRWILGTNACKFYLPHILPYLKIKQRQGQVLLQALKQCKGTGRSQNKKILENCRKKLQRLNARPNPNRLD